MKKTKITTIGGGSGQFVLLSGLRDQKNIDIKAVVSMVDSGGSTGRLRDEMGVLPPGDILKCILALSPNREHARQILQKRLSGPGRLAGHSVGNMLLTILSQYAGSFPDGVKALGETLSIRGEVLPVTVDKATLVAELSDGSHLYGETAIDIPRGDQRKKIERTYLVPHHNDSIKAYPAAVSAIKHAQFVVIGPGDLYTSITPNFLIDEIQQAIERTRAKLIYVVNIMTKFGETDDFSAKDFIVNLEKVIKRRLDFVVINSAKPDKNILKEYQKQKAYLVRNGFRQEWSGRKIMQADLLNTSGDLARHDSGKLAKVIEKILKRQK